MCNALNLNNAICNLNNHWYAIQIHTTIGTYIMTVLVIMILV